MFKVSVVFLKRGYLNLTEQNMILVHYILYFTWLFLEATAIFVSIIGNSLVIYVMSSERQLGKKSSLFILSIAVADLLSSVSVIFLTFVRSIIFWNPADNMHPSLCLWITSVFLVFTTVSVLQMVSVSIDRYWAICCPIFYHTRSTSYTKCGIFACWSLGIIFGITPLLTGLTGRTCNLHIVHNTILSIMTVCALVVIALLYKSIYKAFLQQVKNRFY